MTTVVNSYKMLHALHLAHTVGNELQRSDKGCCPLTALRR